MRFPCKKPPYTTPPIHTYTCPLPPTLPIHLPLCQATKWIAVSNDRFSKVAATTAGVEVHATGAPGEVVVLSWVSLGNATVASMECTVPGSGIFTAMIPAMTCH